MQLAGVMIFVKDLPKMEAFYTSLLGIAPVPETRTETWLEFDTGQTRFSLHAIPPHITVNTGLRETTPLKLTFTTNDLPAELSRLESLGATLIPRPWGSTDAADPEGNIFSLRPRAD